MAQYGILAVNKEFELTVREIKEAHTNYISNFPATKGLKMYCHHFVLSDEDGIEYLCQVCETKDTQNWCNIGDTIGIKVKNFTHEIHTIEFMSRDGRRVAPTASLPGETKPMMPEQRQEAPVIPEGQWTNRAIALFCAATFFTNRHEIDNDTVINKAKEFELYLNK